MSNTHYADPTGLSPENVSTANDLARLVKVAVDYPVIREFTTTPSQYVQIEGTNQTLGFNNSNPLVKSSNWDILLQKTGYIREAGKCLVMMVNIASKPVVIVLLDSLGRYTRVADAQRVKHLLEPGESAPAAILAGVKAAGAKVKRAAAKAKHKRRNGTLPARYAREGKGGNS
jgi:D-alanyl-D-alanine endopeptidase (penicillin-binding protein 7)